MIFVIPDTMPGLQSNGETKLVGCVSKLRNNEGVLWLIATGTEKKENKIITRVRLGCWAAA